VNRVRLVATTLLLAMPAVAGRPAPIDRASELLGFARTDHAALADLVGQVQHPGLRGELQMRLASLGYHLQEADLAVHEAAGDRGYATTWWGHARGYRSSVSQQVSASQSHHMSSSQHSATTGVHHQSAGLSNAHSASTSVSRAQSHQSSVAVSATATAGGPGVAVGSMSRVDWQRIQVEVKRANWEDDKVDVLRAALSGHRVTIDQVIDAMGLVQWSASKLAVAEMMWPMVVDRDQGFRLLSAVRWSADRDALKQRLGL